MPVIVLQDYRYYIVRTIRKLSCHDLSIFQNVFYALINGLAGEYRRPFGLAGKTVVRFHEQGIGREPGPIAQEAMPESSLLRLDVHFVSPAPVYSPLGGGAQHAAPLQRAYGDWRCIYATDI